MMQGRQKMGQQMGKGMGGQSSGLSAQLQQQIAQMKQSLGYGKYGKQGGQAHSGWGLGTSPYAVSPAPAAGSNQVEDRQGDDSLGDTQPIDYEPLYAPEEYAHGFSSEDQLHGQFDPTAAPQKIEEVRSAPEDQESLVAYSEIIGTYSEGEESAIVREQIPLEYQELVRDYFEQLNKRSAGNASSDDTNSEEDEDGSSSSGNDDDSNASENSGDETDDGEG